MQIIDKLIPHIDKGTLHVGEAYIIWTQTTSRYDTLELAQFLESQIHDSDFKAFVKSGIQSLVMKQISTLENLAEEFGIPLGPRPPKNPYMNIETDSLRDQCIYKIILDGSQAAFDIHTKAIKASLNDKLIRVFRSFLEEELDNYEAMLKLGKLKGWVGAPPIYNKTNEKYQINN